MRAKNSINPRCRCRISRSLAFTTYSHHAPAPVYISSRHRHPFVYSSSRHPTLLTTMVSKPPPLLHTFPLHFYTLPTLPIHPTQGVTVERITPGDGINYPKRGGMIPLSIIIFLLSIRIRLCHNSLRGDTHRWEKVRFQSRPVRIYVVVYPRTR